MSDELRKRAQEVVEAFSTNTDCPHGEETWYCVCCRSDWENRIGPAVKNLADALKVSHD